MSVSGFSPLMLKELVVLDSRASLIALILLFLYSINEARKGGKIGRLGIVGNAFFLWQIFYSMWGNLPLWLQLYLNLGTAFAAIAIVSFFFWQQFTPAAQHISYMLYGSFTVLLVAVVFVYGVIPLDSLLNHEFLNLHLVWVL